MGSNGEACGCCAVALVAASVWLRWKDGSGVRSVARGLLGGGVPLAFALVLPTLSPGCTSAGLFSACTAFSLVFGARMPPLHDLDAPDSNLDGFVMRRRVDSVVVDTRMRRHFSDSPRDPSRSSRKAFAAHRSDFAFQANVSWARAGRGELGQRPSRNGLNRPLPHRTRRST